MLSTLAIDLNWAGHSRSIATAVIRSGDFIALVDPGPASTLPHLKRQLALHGLKITNLHSILLTHIHLDHAGATGSLVQENPGLRVFVHSAGAPHLVDPSKLLNSAGRLYGEKMVPLFGDFLPVPRSNIEILEGGELISFGARQLRILYTPGHASHHVIYFDTTDGTAFVGDAAGICIEGHPYILPATPPPDISLELWDRSLDAIANLEPQRLFLTHFGVSENPQLHIENYRNRLHKWSELCGKILSTTSDQTEAIQQFTAAITEEAAPFLSPAELSEVAFTGHLPLSWLGLARYHAKRTGM